MPTAWVPLEIQLAERVEKGVNIISKEELSEMNRNNQIMVLTEEQLEMFLKVQHSLGKLVYFDDVNLRSFIIINPVFLVDVLRSLVTEEQFWPQGPPYDSILRSVCETGLIKQDDILLLWQQKQFKSFLPNKQYLLDMLTHLDVLVIPQTGDDPINQAEESSAPVVPFYMLPSMVQKQDDTSYLHKRCLPHTAIIMAYRFTGEIIPPALTFRFLASLMNMWDVKIYEGRRMLFSDLVVVEVDDEHDVAVQVKGKRVIVSLVHSQNVNNISPTLASTVQECLTASIHRISEFYTGLSGNVDEDSRQEVTIPFEIDFGVVCQSLFGFRKTMCFFPHCDIPSTGDSVWRCFHGTIHHVKNLSLWFAEKVSSGQCQENCKGLGRLELEQCPLDRHIRRVAAEISPYKCREVIIHLGVTVNTWENLEYKYNNQNPDDLKFMALYTWKQANKMVSFYDLAKALRESDVSEHVLCKVFRDIDLPKEYDLEKLSKEPTRKLLRHVSNHIGDSCLQLGIELDLGVSDLENIRYKYRDKLLQQTCVILKQWSRQNPRASVGHLVKAIYRIGKAGCMKGLPL